MLDVIAGDFLIVGLSGQDFASLTPDQMEKYGRQFHLVERFIHIPKDQIDAIKTKNEKKKGKADIEL